MPPIISTIIISIISSIIVIGIMFSIIVIRRFRTRDEAVSRSWSFAAHYLLAPPEEMWVMVSHNILTERNASLVKWNLLPDGEHGLPPPFRNTSQENTTVPSPTNVSVCAASLGIWVLL